MAQHHEQESGGQRLQERIEPEPQGVDAEGLGALAVSSLVANGMRMIIMSQARLNARSRGSIRQAYRKMS
jgi:hypothetical protein